MESTNDNPSVVKGLTFSIPNTIQLQELFEQNVQKINADRKIAVMFDDAEKGTVTQLTYAALEAKANQLARRIMQILGPSNARHPNNDGDYVITVCMEPSEKLIITLLAIWKAGAAYLPLDVNTPINRREHIFSEVNPLMLITDQRVEICQKNTFSYNCLANDSSLLPATALETSEKLPKENHSQTAIILYTSGSTGVSKGVRLPYHVIMNRISWQWRTFPFENSEHVCIFKTAITFVDAVSEVWAPLLHSDPRTLLVVPKHVTKNPEKLLHILNSYKIERLVLVPSLLQAILMYLEMRRKQLCGNEDFLANLKLWVCSGEPLPVALVKRFFSYFSSSTRKLCNFYGSTEIMGDVSYYVLSPLEQLAFQDKIPIGIPLSNTSLYIVDSNFQLAKQGQIGELLVSGYNLAAGYVAGRDPEKFVNNPFCAEYGFDRVYRTGDYAKIIDNVLMYEGRCDSQIKIRGQRIDLSEVQSALNNLNGINKSAVLCYKPGDINQAIVAFVTLNPGFAVSGRKIQDMLKKHLVSYAIPQVFIIDNIPLLNNGKVDRQALLKLYANKSENKVNSLSTEVDYSGIDSSKLNAAKCLFDTVNSVLGDTIHQPLSANINFYDIGGNSLNCIQTITKLRDRGYFISIADFISAPNFGAVVSCMQKEKHAKENIPNELEVKQKNFCKNNYKYEMLQEKSKQAVFKIITDSFFEKADLEQWLVPRPKRECYLELMDAIWDPLVSKGLSFSVYSDEEGKYVGVCLNFDAYEEPEVNIQSNLTIIFEFLEYLESPARKKLPVGKQQILHSFMMGTDSSLTAAQNIQVVTCMENEILNLANRKGFAGVFTTNTNALTQQLGTDVFKYFTLFDYKVNQYVAADGSKPFALAPDEQRVICCWKPIKS